MSLSFVSQTFLIPFSQGQNSSTCTKTKQQTSRHCFFSPPVSPFFSFYSVSTQKAKQNKPRVYHMERQMVKRGFSHISNPLPPCEPSQSAAAQLCTPARRWCAARGGVLLMWVPPCGTVLSWGSGKKRHLLPCNNLFLQKASGFMA